MAKATSKLRSPGAKAPTVDDALKALGMIAQEVPTLVDFKAYSLEVEGKGGDRGSAILIATTLENCLDVAIMRTMDLKPSRQREMLRPGAAFGEFGNKIILGHALKIYGAQTRTNLDRIRSIRNAFAHAKIPISFDTPEVMAVCATLQLQSLLFPSPRDSPEWAVQPPGYNPVGKERYADVCNGIGSNLMWWSSRAIVQIDHSALKVPIDESYTVAATRKPLP